MKIKGIMEESEPSIKSVKELEIVNISLKDINKEDIKFLDIEPNLAYQYEGDFYGLLNHLKRPVDDFILLLSLNGMITPTQWKGDKNYIAYI